MNGHGLNDLWGGVFWFGIPLAIVFLVARVVSRRNWKKAEYFYKKSWANQSEIIDLLKEIRDSLRR